jgi:hypothetical protein
MATKYATWLGQNGRKEVWIMGFVYAGVAAVVVLAAAFIFSVVDHGAQMREFRMARRRHLAGGGAW